MSDPVNSPTVTDYVSNAGHPYWDDPRGWYANHMWAVGLPQAARKAHRLADQLDE